MLSSPTSFEPFVGVLKAIDENTQGKRTENIGLLLITCDGKIHKQC